MATKKKLLQAAAGAAGGSTTDIDDVFSTYLYEGNNAIKVIDNGIALGNAGDGGSGEFVLNGGGSNEAGYLSIPSSTDFGFGTGDFTIEMFVYPRATQGYSGFFSTINTGTPVGVMVGTFSDGTLTFDFNSTSGGSSEASALTNGAWSHVALTRNGTSVNLWVNGTSVATATNSDNLGSSESAVIGRFYTTMNGFGFNGHLSNVRVIKGTALYTSSFTAPTSALTAVSGTVLLTLQGDEPFTDNSSSSHTLTANSTVYTSAFGPFTGTSGEGGLVWLKNRDASGAANIHGLFDTERGTSARLDSSSTDAEASQSGVTSFNSNGFAIGNSGSFNRSSEGIVSWTWRKAPKFFDVVTWTGNGVDGRAINHNLGSVPGMIIVKDYSNTGENWTVYHRGIDVNGDNAPETDGIYLNTTGAAGDESGFWNDTAPTSTQFTVGVNLNSTFGGGANYVAYLFAHNDGDGEFGPDGDQDIIKCGSFSGSSSSDVTVNVGFEPQWLLTRRTGGGNWTITDNMRGLVTGGIDNTLFADTSGAENTAADRIDLTPTGFIQKSGQTGNETVIYIAIRRGPLAEPESATDVFAIDQRGGTSPTPPMFNSGFVTDFAIWFNTGTNPKEMNYRLGQGVSLDVNASTAEHSQSSRSFDYMNGWGDFSSSVTSQYAWMWKRAPSFCDVATYSGNNQSSAITVNHNLGVVPEMMWCKKRGASGDWMVYHKDLNGGTNPHTYRLRLNSTGGEGTGSGVWNAAPTATQFSVGTDYDVNSGTVGHVTFLFATLAGISKVGSYTGNGNAGRVIDCGFSNGARFVLARSYTHADNWFVFDSERGIVAGNDPYVRLNTTDAEITNADLIDVHSSGFIVNNANGDLNDTGRSYIFYAIAT